MRARRGAATVVMVLVLLAGVSCRADGGTAARSDSSLPEATTTVPTTPSRPVAFDTWTETFVDTSRGTPAGAETPAAPSRTLETTIYLPRGDAPVPLIVFAHGSAGHPEKFSRLLEAWASAGYAVAAPAFPLTNGHVPGASQNSADLVNQPADVSFVLDQVLAASQGADGPLAGRIDPDRVGAAGLSLGGATTYAVVFDDCCRDERFKAAEVLAGAALPAWDGQFVFDGHVPLLIMHGDQDPALRHDLAVAVFSSAAPPVWFVTLLGAGHAGPFENETTPYDGLVEQVTVDFWDGTLGGDPAGLDRLPTDGNQAGLSVLESR